MRTFSRDTTRRERNVVGVALIRASKTGCVSPVSCASPSISCNSRTFPSAKRAPRSIFLWSDTWCATMTARVTESMVEAARLVALTSVRMNKVGPHKGMPDVESSRSDICYPDSNLICLTWYPTAMFTKIQGVA